MANQLVFSSCCVFEVRRRPLVVSLSFSLVPHPFPCRYLVPPCRPFLLSLFLSSFVLFPLPSVAFLCSSSLFLVHVALSFVVATVLPAAFRSLFDLPSSPLTLLKLSLCPQ